MARDRFDRLLRRDRRSGSRRPGESRRQVDQRVARGRCRDGPRPHPSNRPRQLGRPTWRSDPYLRRDHPRGPRAALDVRARRLLLPGLERDLPESAPSPSWRAPRPRGLPARLDRAPSLEAAPPYASPDTARSLPVADDRLRGREHGERCLVRAGRQARLDPLADSRRPRTEADVDVGPSDRHRCSDLLHRFPTTS